MPEGYFEIIFQMASSSEQALACSPRPYSAFGPPHGSSCASAIRHCMFVGRRRGNLTLAALCQIFTPDSRCVPLLCCNLNHLGRPSARRRGHINGCAQLQVTNEGNKMGGSGAYGDAGAGSQSLRECFCVFFDNHPPPCPELVSHITESQ
jgi:hypothetical protein